MKFEARKKAIKLRKLGYTYTQILEKVSVSRSTLSIWLRDVELTTSQKEYLYNKSRQKNAYRLAKLNQARRIERTKSIIEISKKEALKMFNNPLFSSGLMLYWAEGDKSDSNEIVKFTNSDPNMISLMISWFQKIGKVEKSKIKLTLHIHELHKKSAIEKYWSKVTGIPSKHFYKTQIKKTSLGQRRNCLYNGTCSIRVNSRELFRKIKGWRLGFIEKLMFP
ncbi:MAG: helix-turn-helix domain-containing protein [Patescibacteria group bacterium]